MAPDPAAQEEPISAALLAAVLEAANPRRLLTQMLYYSPGKITAGPHQMLLPEQGRLWLIALGKAAPTMAEAAFEIFGDRIDGGLVTTLAGHNIHPPERLRPFVCGHPVPNDGSLAAGAYAASMLADGKPEDRALVLVSGGGSAMFELLPPGVDLKQWADITDRLIRSGLPIQVINQVRRRVSLVKNGGLAQLAAPAQTIGCILSDVIGNSLSMVASGPTIPAVHSSLEAQSLLSEAGLWQSFSVELQQKIQSPTSLGQTIFQPANILLGGNEIVVAAAKRSMESFGYETRVVSAAMAGEASEVGREFGLSLGGLEPGQAFLMGGETTVSVKGKGRGGPCQELALAAALELADTTEICLFALASDGIDGNSPAAGALVNHKTVDNLKAEGVDPRASLQDNDSYSALASIGAAVEIGLTGTNLNDLVVGWRPRDE